MNDRRIATILAAFALTGLVGCTTTIIPTHFTPTSTARANAAIKLDNVRYLRQRGVEPNEVEFHKAGRVLVARPIADLVREDILKELEHSGFHLGEGGAVLSVDVNRCTLLDKFTSLELALETTYRLQVGQKTVSRDLRAARRHTIYSNSQKAVDLNAMVSETYEVFFTDPEVRAALAAPRVLATAPPSPGPATQSPLPALAVGAKLFSSDGAPFGTVVLISDTEVAVALSGGGTATMTKEQAVRMQR